MKEYKIKLKHDKGTVNIKTVAKNEKTAINIICNSENCPVTAIKSIKELKTI